MANANMPQVTWRVKYIPYRCTYLYVRVQICILWIFPAAIDCSVQFNYAWQRLCNYRNIHKESHEDGAQKNMAYIEHKLN